AGADHLALPSRAAGPAQLGRRRLEAGRVHRYDDPRSPVRRRHRCTVDRLSGGAPGGHGASHGCRGGDGARPHAGPGRTGPRPHRPDHDGKPQLRSKEHKVTKNPARAVLRRIRAPFGWAFRKYRAARVFQIALKKLWRKEMQWDVPLTKRKPRWWLKGFLSRSAILYELEQGNDPARYVTDVHRYFRTKNMVHARLQDIINNKLSTHLLLRSMDIRSPELIGVYSRGLVHFFPAEGRMPVADYLESMEQDETVFFKVLAGAEGNNIHAVQRTSDATWAVDGVDRNRASAASVFTRVTKPMIIERGLVQHPDQAALFDA